MIPERSKVNGETFRAMDEGWRYKAHRLITKQVKGMAEAMGAEADILIDVGYPTVDNDPVFTEQAFNLAKEYMSEENVQETELRMGAEDFGYYTQHVPGCFFRLGVRNESAGIVHNVHTPFFNIDERAIEDWNGHDGMARSNFAVR